MKSKISSSRKLSFVVLVGLILIPVLLFFLTRSSPGTVVQIPISEKAVATPEQEQTRPGLPVRLKIPGITIDAAVEPMGLTPDGAMDTTKGPDNVGWYKLGQRPGENGSSVITGHYTWINGLSAAFDNLHKLRAGDKLSVEDDKGVVVNFVVRELRTYGEHDDTASVFSSNDGKAHLNLITCEGIWNKTSKSYSNRLVVFTDKE